MISPHPEIMMDTKIAKSFKPEEAVKRLITKLLLSVDMVGEVRSNDNLRLIRKFWDEHYHYNFWNRLGKYDHDHIWIEAKKETCLAYSRHKKYSSIITDMMRKLTCLMMKLWDVQRPKMLLISRALDISPP